jgi:regulatory protein
MRRRPPRDPEARPTVSIRYAALRLLGRRDYTRAEIITRLVDKGYPPDEVGAIVEALVADRSIDDRRAALAHIRTAARLKGRGRMRIARELEQRGISKDIARDALAELPVEDERAAIQRFLERKRFPERPTAAERRRAFQQLLRRGFTVDAVSKVLRGELEDEE